MPDAATSLWFDPSLCLINGEWVTTADTLPLVDPSDGSELAQIARGGAPEIDAAVAAAEQALGGAWGLTSAVERGRLLTKLGQLVLDQVDLLADLEARDVGKPLSQGRADAIALARHRAVYGGAADKVLGVPTPYFDCPPIPHPPEHPGATGHMFTLD